MDKKSRIFIVNHKSMVGLGLVRHLRDNGFTNLILASSADVDLLDHRATNSFFKKKNPDYCILAPIREGGIAANINYPAELIYQNLAIQTNVIHAAGKARVKKLLFFASSCVYPKNCPQPMKEKYLLTGQLELSNEPYAIAKIAGIKMCQAYNRQFGTNFISIIPATIFGRQDNFQAETAHVIPALLRKFYLAKKRRHPKVVIWGTGRPRREFIYIDDIAEASLFIMKQVNRADIINVGVGSDISIKNLAQLIRDIVGFKGKIEFDSAKPSGTYRKLLDCGKINSLGWQARANFETDLKKTFDFYSKGILEG